ncbi:MAG: trypsin-like peptidase domain-containing protein [Clostridia bacterium]|nr:trypsin-like peptidase domain-containing protein [Clostridia bacterium]
MRRIIYFCAILIVLLCSIFIASCSNEELDHVHQYQERTLDSNGASCKGPTCTLSARREQVCSICEHIIPIEVIPAKGHTPLDWQVKTEASCTVNKVEEKLCKDCGEVVETKVYPLVGHTPGDWQTITNGTCTQNEVKGRICKVCTEVVEKSVEPLKGHTKSEEWQIITNATCTDNLVRSKNCTTCGEILETFVGEKLEHDYDEAIVSGTCAKGEHKLYTCKLCGYHFESEFLKPTEAHTEGSWVVEIAPTCSAEGIKKQICSSCGTALNRQNIPIDTNNHSFLVETFPPVNDSEEGYVKYTCKSCGYEITNIYESNYLPSQIYEMIVSSTVRIEACDKDGKSHNMGSGFFVSAEGEIVTNYHVIAGAYKLKVKLYGGDEYEVVAVRGYDAQKDIALLKIDIEGNSYLKLSSTEVKTGDPVYALGSPLGVDNIFTDGIISNPSKSINGQPMIVFTAPISVGSSGGPLVNARGEVVGINSQYAEKGQNMNFAIGVKAITEIEPLDDKTVQDVYAQTLKANGVNVLAYHIMLNYDKKIDNKYIIERVVVAETGKGYGRTLQIAYDSDSKVIVLSINWVDGGKQLYSTEFYLNAISETYTVKFFDHGWSQYTVEGTLSTKVQAIKNNIALDTSVYNKIFEFDYINYAESSSTTLTVTLAKQLIGTAYIDMLGSFNTILEESETGLLLEHFNFQLPQDKAQN